MIILVTGVSGAGKTTVGSLLARELGWKFADADSYHSPENIRKMTAGVPLTDNDREPWLRVLRQTIQSWIANSENVVLACSALKRRYREQLMVGPEVRLVFLSGNFTVIERRMKERHGHYMRSELLKSQFDDLEPPTESVTISVSTPPEDAVSEIRKLLRV